jgi:methylamine---glutamate N-methyltransferase subunit B
MTMSVINVHTKDLRSTNAALREALNGHAVKVENAGHLHGLASGLKHGCVEVEGDAGDYLAALNAGAEIRVRGNAGKYAADNMTSGTVIIEGSTGDGTGQYCYGGTLVVYGSTGDFTATMNKGANILVVGDVGDEAATYMLKGNLVVVGNAGWNFANYLIRGSVYIGGSWQSLGHNTRHEPLAAEDTARLEGFFKTYGIQANPASFKKIVAASEKPFYK